MILLLIFISVFLGLNFRFSLIPIGIISLIFLLFTFKRFKKKAGIISSIFIIASIGISFINFSFSQHKFEGFVLESKENYFILTNGLEKFYVYEKENTREVGDFLSIKGEKEKVDFEVLESSFDFNDHLYNKGIYYEIQNPEISVRFNSLIKSKHYKNQFLNHFSGETRSFLSLLMFSSDYSSNDAKIMENVQLNRLMSTSGLYLHAIFIMLSFFFSLFLKEKYSKWISFTIIFLYSIVLFPKFNVIRFTLFTLFSLINEYILKRKISYLDRLSIIGLLCLTFDYHLAYQDSFIIGFFLPMTIYFTRFTFNRFKWYIKPILFTLSIYVFMIPFTLKFNNFINIFALPLQIILSPIFILMYVFGFIGFIGVPVYPFINFIYEIITNLLNFFNLFSLKIHAPPLSPFYLFLFEMLYFAFHYYFSIIFKPIYKGVGLSFVILLLIYFVPINNLITQEVSFINVGQGDSTLIRKGNSVIMIDTGGSKYKDIANDVLIPYLRKKRIYDIDALIITHDDYDHNGALNELQKRIKVKKIFDDKTDFPVSVNGITFNNLNLKTYEEDNENSLVIQFQMWDKKFLVMGDASKEVEKEILKQNDDLECDILRIGHHGSNTSTSDEFIKALKPEEAIISVGNNYYGHPHDDVLYVLNKYNIKVRRTDIEGTIRYSNYIFM